MTHDGIDRRVDSKVSYLIKRTLQTRFAILASLVFACPGCVVETTTRDPNSSAKLVLPRQETFEILEANDLTLGAAMTTQNSFSSSFTFERLGAVGYDGFTLPVFSNDEEDIIFATQDGGSPSLDALMGKPGSVAGDQSVVIRRLNRNGEIELIARHPAPLFLGRNGNSKGMLVEKPRPDGSRAIGLASWSDDSLIWLVDDDAINAYGWISESGSLVYSSMAKNETEFKLKVLERDGTVWEIPESLPYSWILPTWCVEEGLFAIRMGDGYADLAWGRSENAGAFRKSLNTHRISERFSASLAWQTLASTTGGNGVSGSMIAWYSFEDRSLSLWNGPSNSMQALPEETLACTRLSNEDEWLITTPDSLDRILLLEDSIQETQLLSTPWVCRRASQDTMIVVKAYEGKLELGRLTFGVTDLPAEDIENTPEAEPEYRYNIRE